MIIAPDAIRSLIGFRRFYKTMPTTISVLGRQLFEMVNQQQRQWEFLSFEFHTIAPDNAKNLIPVRLRSSPAP